MEKFKNHEELTIAERKIIGAGDIRLNRIKCNACGDVITSEHRHDYKKCSCKRVSVDGGSWYIKRSFTKAGDYKELSERYEDAI